MVEHQICTFFLNNIYFGIDIQQIQEVIRLPEMTRVPLAPPDICGLINLRGQIVTIIDLRRRLEMADKSSFVGDEQAFNIVIRHQDEVVSLLVDGVDDVIEVQKENFEPPPVTLKGRMRQMLSGAYKLDRGLLLVLDVEKILAVKGEK
ncbi:MAG: purine-binding chemotaxis protein CheW [Nostocaceae cyanobacterium]|nr:purine-binding chemotaxis protein CheW [Nostocaceae cyanobacterium]